MNNKKFLECVKDNEIAQRRLRSAAFAAFEGVAADNDITIDDISQDEMKELADGFVKRGLHND